MSVNYTINASTNAWWPAAYTTTELSWRLVKPKPQRKWSGPWRLLHGKESAVWVRPYRTPRYGRMLRQGPTIPYPKYDETDMTPEDFEAAMQAGTPADIRVPCDDCKRMFDAYLRGLYRQEQS